MPRVMRRPCADISRLRPTTATTTQQLRQHMQLLCDSRSITECTFTVRLNLPHIMWQRPLEIKEAGQTPLPSKLRRCAQRRAELAVRNSTDVPTEIWCSAVKTAVVSDHGITCIRRSKCAEQTLSRLLAQCWHLNIPRVTTVRCSA
jgi:hypothetical protein